MKDLSKTVSEAEATEALNAIKDYAQSPEGLVALYFGAAFGQPVSQLHQPELAENIRIAATHFGSNAIRAAISGVK